MMPPDTRIAGQRTVADWQNLRAKLVDGNDTSPWKEAFEGFFFERLRTRYYAPIQLLEKMPDKNGEGFAIVAIQCSLIEFLASTIEGKTYRYRRNGDPPLGEFEYSNSGDVFRGFLTHHIPFTGMFPDDAAASDFYSNVRCGLLHEARTRGTWRIRVCQNASQAIDTEAKIIFRNKMQAEFDEFTRRYGDQLRQCAQTQQAFIRKFDSLCDD